MNRHAVTISSALVLLLACQPGHAADARTSAAELRGSQLRGQQLADGEEVRRSGADDRKALTLTVYQDGQSLVRDGREVGLISGRNRLALADVSPRLLPESLHLSGEGAPRVRAQRYEQALLTSDNLLKAHVGHDILLVRDRNGEDEQVRGRLLSVAGGVPVVAVGDRVELLEPGSPWRIAFRDVGDGLRAEPGLVLDLETGMTGRQELELLYLSDGLAWQADYVLRLDDESLNLTAWASVDNSTGIAFDNARVRLVAGEPNRGGAPTQRMERAVAMSDAGSGSRPAGGYHLFELADPVSLAMGERTQLPLFRATEVPMSREYRVESAAWGPMRGEQSQAVSVHLRFDNAGQGLNRAMPSGTARVYQQDADGETLFLGQDQIHSTPAGNPVELRVGTAFDVTALRTQQDFRRLDERSEQQAWRIRLANAGNKPVPVRVIEVFSGEWTMLESSASHERLAADRAEWTIEVPAEGSTELTYRVEIRR
ncbi:MAG: DUF4139 domain-containing protein [Aquisalimonadaceae bacterium]